LVQTLIKYAEEKNITLELNERYPIFNSVVTSEIVKILINYVNKNDIDFKINNFDLIKNVSYESLELLIEYAIKNNIVLNYYRVNDKDHRCNTVLSCAVYNNRDRLVKLIMDYAFQNFILLKVNSDGNDFISSACFHNNTNMVKVLIDYANHQNILLNINSKDMNGNYPLLWACLNNNYEIVKLLIQYANENGIVLKLNEYDMNCKTISELSDEVIELFNEFVASMKLISIKLVPSVVST